MLMASLGTHKSRAVRQAVNMGAALDGNWKRMLKKYKIKEMLQSLPFTDLMVKQYRLKLRKAKEMLSKVEVF